MNDKPTNIFSDYVAGRMTRRELVTRAGKLGLGAAAAGMMLGRKKSVRRSVLCASRSLLRSEAKPSEANSCSGTERSA